MDASIDFSGVLKGSIADGGGGGGGDTVIITPVVTSGTKIADVSVNGVDKDLYCPTPPTPTEVEITPVVTSGTKIADVSIDGVEKDLYSPDYRADITALDGRLDTAEYNITDIKQSLSQLDGLVIYKDLTPTDDYAEFNDGLNLPLLSLISTIEPIQEGIGDPSPENVRPISGFTEANISNAGDNRGDCADIPEPLTANKWYTVNLPYNTYTISFDAVNVVRTHLGNTSMFAISNGTTNTNILADRIYSVEDGATYQSKGANINGRFYFTYTGKLQSLGCFWRSNSYQSLTSGALENIMIEDGNNATKQYTPYNGQTYKVKFKDGDNPLTVYSGSLDVVSGVLTVDRAFVDLGSLTWTYQSTQTVFSTEISGLKRDILICSNYKYTDVNNVERMNDGEIWDKNNVFSPTNVVVKDLRYTSASDFKTAMNGVQLVYELATPQTYQLTPTQVKSLLGQNYISSDVGDITNVKYLGILNLS